MIIRFAACVVTTGAAFFATLQWNAPATDAPAQVTPVMHAVPLAAVQEEDECALLRRSGSFNRAPENIRRAILKYALCDGSGPSRM